MVLGTKNMIKLQKKLSMIKQPVWIRNAQDTIANKHAVPPFRV